VVSPLACGADLLRWIRAHWTGGPLVLGLDASHRRDDVVLLRMSVLYRGAALPVAWVIVPANQPGAWEPHGERMLRWARSALPRDQEVLTLADQGVWSPRRWHAIRSQQFHPIMRVRPTSTFAPTGQVRQAVLRLAPGPGHGWVGVGVAFKHAPKRIAGTLAVAWGADHAEPWAPLGERSAARVDAAWDALRSWDEAGFRQSTSMGWDWQRGQVTDPDAGGLAVSGSGDGHAVDGGRRHADRRCRTAGGSARSLEAGAADDRRAAAPSLERHGAAGEPPAPAGGMSAPALVAGARALLGPLVVAPGALAQNR
jgi:hypothetical protein